MKNKNTNYKKENKAGKRINGSWIYFIIVLIALFALFFIQKQAFVDSSLFFLKLLKKIIPVLIAIFFLMSLINYFVSPKKISKYLGKNSGIEGWLIAVSGGIISHGPIYVWYPLLADLKSKGMRFGLITTFIYNRAIKIPLIPFMIIYFSWQYVLVLTLVMIIFSVISGLVVEFFMLNSGENKHTKNK